MHCSGREDEFVQNPDPVCPKKTTVYRVFFTIPEELWPPKGLPVLSVPKKLGEDISLKKKTGLRHWAGFETLALGCRWWKHQCDTWIIVICSLGSNLQKQTWMFHSPITLLLDTEFLICFLVAFRYILRLSTVSVKCSIRCLLFMEHFCSRCWFTLNSNLSEENGGHSTFLSRKVKIVLLWFFGFQSGISREMVGTCTPKFLTALANPAADTSAHFLICHEQAVTLWTQDHEFLYSHACECFCLHVFDHSQHETEIV